MTKDKAAYVHVLCIFAMLHTSLTSVRVCVMQGNTLLERLRLAYCVTLDFFQVTILGLKPYLIR